MIQKLRISGKTHVVGRMPVSGKNSCCKKTGYPIDHRNDPVAISDPQRASGQKIILHVNNKQCIVSVNRCHGYNFPEKQLQQTIGAMVLTVKKKREEHR